MSSDIRLDALQYHSQPRPGKVETLPCKPCFSQRDLTLAYSPGVAEPCLRIQEDPSQSALYTGRSNLVGVITNGTAVLGLGNIGPDAAKPVMEGKGVLFKVFADIDVFDIELNVKEPEKLIETIKTMEPTFGAINLEDIKAPECFMVEERLRQEMNIPVFHDDQHGTAVISGAALLNAAELTGRKLEDMKVVVVGAGAAGISCAKFYMTLGVRREHIYMFDSKGLITIPGALTCTPRKPSSPSRKIVPWRRPSPERTCSWGFPPRDCSRRTWSSLWLLPPSFSPVRIRTRKSLTRMPKKRGLTASWDPDVPTGPTR